jgi:creatinine amidohydrolase
MLEKENQKLYYQYNRKPEIVEHVKKCDIAILPVGAIEQHGQHLPTGEDSFHAMGISEVVAKSTGAMILPCPWYGAHPHMHLHYPGTIPLRFETFKNLVIDIVKGAAEIGFNKFVIFNCHGQEWAIPPAVQELGTEGYFVIAPTLWEILKSKLPKILETYFLHGCEAETSLGLSIVPDLVEMSLACGEEKPGLLDKKWYAGPNDIVDGRMPWYAATTWKPENRELKYGAKGFPEKGTKEKGDKMVQAASEWLIEIIEEIKEKYPPGVKPETKP